MKRRQLLLALVATAGAVSCARPPIGGPQGDVPSDPTVDALLAEAATALADSYHALETLEVYGAWRVSRFDGSPRRAPGELPWDPPTPSAWATTLAFASRSQRQFADFYQRAALSVPDPGVWRDRRALAAAGKALVEMGATLQEISELLPNLGPSDDGERLQRLVGQAWSRWEDAAGVWDRERAESLVCP